MRKAHLTVTWVWVALALAFSAKGAPIGTFNQLDLSDRPIFAAKQPPLVSFSDTNGNHLHTTASGQSDAQHAHYTSDSPPSPPTLLSFPDDSQSDISSAIAQVVQPAFDGPGPLADDIVGQESLLPTHPHVSWAAPMIRPGVFAPIPHIEQTTVTIITGEDPPSNSTAGAQQNKSGAVDATPASPSTVAASTANGQNATQQPISDAWPAFDAAASQKNITQPLIPTPANTTIPLSPPNEVQVAKSADADGTDDNVPADNLFAPDVAANATNGNITTAQPIAAPPLKQRRNVPRRASGTEQGQAKSRRSVLVQHVVKMAKRAVPQTSCRDTSELFVPVTHTELYEIRAGRLDPTFTAHERLGAFDEGASEDDGYDDAASCSTPSRQHHHLILVPVSESQLAHIESGMLHLEVSAGGQVVLQEIHPSHNTITPSDVHAVAKDLPMIHFYEHADASPTTEYDIAWPERRSRSASTQEQAAPRLVRRILESHGFDAKLVGNGENKTYHGRLIHDAGDGPYEDAHTLHLDSAPETKEIKPQEKKPEEPAPAVPVVATATTTKSGSNNNNNNNAKPGDKSDKKKKNTGGKDEDKGKPSPTGPAAPVAAAAAGAVPGPPAPPLNDDEDHRDRDDVLDDVRDGDRSGHDKAAALAYWGGKSHPDKVSAEKAKEMHNAAASSLARNSATLPCTLAAVTVSALVVAVL